MLSKRKNKKELIFTNYIFQAKLRAELNKTIAEIAAKERNSRSEEAATSSKDAKIVSMTIDNASSVYQCSDVKSKNRCNMPTSLMHGRGGPSHKRKEFLKFLLLYL